MTNKKNILFLLLLVGLIISACNFPIPIIPDRSTRTPTPAQPTAAIPTKSPGGEGFPTNSAGLEIFPTNTPLAMQPTLSTLEGYSYYYAQSGDTLTAVASRFGVDAGQILSDQPISFAGLINPGQLLILPDALGLTYSSEVLLPDSEVIYSPSARDFNVEDVVKGYGGYLARFEQQVGLETLTGAQIVQRVAQNTSVNPRLLLAVIEYRSHWLTTAPAGIDEISPLGFFYDDFQGLYLELSLAAKWLNMGYYGWRQGTLTQLTFGNGSSVRIPPQSNAGSVALQYFFAQIYPQGVWEQKLYGADNFLSLYTALFGDAQARAAAVEPLFPVGFSTPALELPFAPGEEWALTGGLHVDWNTGTPWGALDFAPITGETPCKVSRAWVLAAAPGTVIRSSNNIVVISLEDENLKPTGWELFYMHIARQDSIAAGTRVVLDDRIGHPSCEGGQVTGTHVHFARKYKGEWIGAGDAFPLVLSGWTALPAEKQFRSVLYNGSQIVTARQDGSIDSRIFR